MSDTNSPDPPVGRDGEGASRFVIDRVAAIDSDLFDRGFTIGLLVFTLILIAMSFDYKTNARFFPLIVSIPMAVILLILTVIQLSDRAAEVANKYGGTSALPAGIEDIGEGAEVETDLTTIRKNGVWILSWMVMLLSLIALTGHVVGISLFLLLIYRFYGQQSWPRSVVYAFINIAFIVLIFMVALNARLYGGIFS